MDMCWQKRPQHYPAGAQRAACYLHRPGADRPATVVMGEGVAVAD